MIELQGLVSVVVPVYNVQSYVYDCLESLRKQDYSNIEVIIVDDGATDNSRSVCEEFIKRHQDNRFKLFSKKNGGLADARNFGISKCSENSKFVVFVDSDDEVTEDFVSSLTRFADDDSLVIGKLLRCSSKPAFTEGFDDVRLNEYTDIWKNEQFLSRLKDGILNSACAKCYSLNVIRRYSLRFENTLPEDTLFNLAYSYVVNRIVCLYKDIYYYFVRTQSMSTNPKECIYTNYIKIQKELFEKTEKRFHKYINWFVYPHYRANTTNYILKHDYDTPVFFLKNPFVRQAFDAYSPGSLGDWLYHFLMKRRLLNLVALLH